MLPYHVNVECKYVTRMVQCLSGTTLGQHKKCADGIVSQQSEFSLHTGSKLTWGMALIVM